MKTDKYKNKDKSTFSHGEDLHGKPEKRKEHRKKAKMKNMLKNVNQMDFDELDDLDIDNFEKL